MSELARNKRAYFEYHVLESMEAGIELVGSEVKAIKAHLMSFSDAYVRIINNEAWLVHFHISEYPQANLMNHEPLRQRRLLLHAKELKKLSRAGNNQGITIVPLRIYTKRALIKLEIALCRGKRLYDKREQIKQRDVELALQREIKGKL